MARVDILMPVFNTAKYVGEAIDSVLGQTFSDLRLILVDDGSTDGSHSVLEARRRQDSRIEVISRSNRGLIATRNELLDRSSAEFLVWLDSDDIAPRERVERQIARLVAEPDLACVGGEVLCVDPIGRPICREHWPVGRRAVKDGLRVGGGLRIGAAAMRRDAAVAIGGFRHPFKMGEDFDFLLRISERGEVDNIEDIVLFYRQHPSGTSHVSAQTWGAYRDYVIKLARERATTGEDELQRSEPASVSLPDPAEHRSRIDPYETHVSWARKALSEGHTGTAWSHAFAAIRRGPLNVPGWRILARCAFGRAPHAPAPVRKSGAPLAAGARNSYGAIAPSGSVAEPPRVSVLMPVFNTARYVEEALESIINQTFTAFELVVIDDGSSDESPAILRRIASHEPRMRLIIRENRGLIATRNQLLAETRCELIAWMDSDDVALPKRLARQVAEFDARPDLVCLGSAVQTIDPEGLKISIEKFPLDNEGIVRQQQSGGAMRFPSVMMRSQAARTAGGFRMPFVIGEDFDLFLRLSEIGSMGNLAEPLLRYREHERSASATLEPVWKTARDLALNLAAQRRGGRQDALQRGEPVLMPQAVPRPVPAADLMAVHVRWARRAIDSRNIRTAWKHVLAALATAPLNPVVWRALLRITVATILIILTLSLV